MTKKIVSYDDVPAVGARLPAAVQAEITALAPGSVSTNTIASIDSEIALFSGTTGKVLKRAAGSGIVKALNGVYSLITAPATTLVGADDQQSLSLKTLLSPKINGNDAIMDTNGNEVLAVGQTAAAVNEFKVFNAAATTGPRLVAQGADTAVRANVESKGGAGVWLDGDRAATLTAPQTFTASRFLPRVTLITSSPTQPVYNVDVTDILILTGQTANIADMSASQAGSPITEQPFRVAITGTGARTIGWGSKFESGPATLPTTTIGTQRLDACFFYNLASGKFRCYDTGSA